MLHVCINTRLYACTIAKKVLTSYHDTMPVLARQARHNVEGAEDGSRQRVTRALTSV